MTSFIRSEGAIMSAALITGASKGFGRALALDLAAGGWDLVVDARGAEALEEVATRLRSVGTGSIRAIVGDVADPDHRARLVGELEGSGRLDLLVNNASVLGPSPQPTLDRYPLDALADVYRVNVLGPLGLIQAALPLLRASRGTIVNVTSDAAVEGYEGWGGYGSSKAALEQLTNVLASEEPGLRVYRFDPGDMRTEMHQDAFPGEDISDLPAPETVVPALRRLLQDRPPSGRYRAVDLQVATR
jgi:NAD(P)-dependent dehydrogenase (short-subunit alcohol dehydrogenase family)